jgi:hypothetical protein
MKNYKIKNYTSLLLYVFLVITLIILSIFFYRSSTLFIPDDADFQTKVDAYGHIVDVLLYWSYGLLILALFFSVFFPVKRLIQEPKKGIKSLIALGIFAVIVLIAYAFSDGTPLNLKGYMGQDNVSTTLKFADTLLYTTYFLLVLAVLSVIYSEIVKAFK